MESCCTNGGMGNVTRAYRGNGLDDWYLRARDELSQIHLQRTLFGLVDGTGLLASEQAGVNTVHEIAASTGGWMTFTKHEGNVAILTSAIRSF